MLKFSMILRFCEDFTKSFKFTDHNYLSLLTDWHLKTAYQSALALLTFLSDLWVLLRSPSTESHFSTWQHSLSIFVWVSHGLFLKSIRYRRKSKVEIPEIETKKTLNDKYNLNRQISSAFLLTFIPDKMHDYSEFLRVIYNLQRLKATDCFIKKLHHRF